MKVDGTLVLLALGGGGLLFLLSRGGFGAAPIATLPSGQRVASDGTVYDATGRVIGRTAPENYVRALASQGKAAGEPAAQTLATIKAAVSMSQAAIGIGQSLYNTISSVLGSTTSTVPTADILRDRIIDDPATAAPPGSDVPTAEILREPEALDDWLWEETPWFTEMETAEWAFEDESWLAEMDDWGGWENPITYEPIDWAPEVTWEEAYDVAW